MFGSLHRRILASLTSQRANAMNNVKVPNETAEQSAAWDSAFAASTDVLDTIAAEAQADLAQVPADANDTAW